MRLAPAALELLHPLLSVDRSLKETSKETFGCGGAQPRGESGKLAQLAAPAAKARRRKPGRDFMLLPVVFQAGLKLVNRNVDRSNGFGAVSAEIVSRVVQMLTSPSE